MSADLLGGWLPQHNQRLRGLHVHRNARLTPNVGGSSSNAPRWPSHCPCDQGNGHLADLRPPPSQPVSCSWLGRPAGPQFQTEVMPACHAGDRGCRRPGPASGAPRGPGGFGVALRHQRPDGRPSPPTRPHRCPAAVAKLYNNTGPRQPRRQTTHQQVQPTYGLSTP
jgi:hypothetical protein